MFNFTCFKYFLQTKKLYLALFSVLSFVFLVYFKTLAPTYTWQHWGSDAGDLIAAVFTWGIPHPPGTPFYILIAQPFRLLPWGDPAYKMNFASAIFGLGAVGILFLTVFRVTRSLLASFLASLFLAFGRVFWSQAIITEVYTLNTLLVGLVIYFLINWQIANSARESKKLEIQDSWLYLALFCFGLALANHTSSLMLAPAILYLILATYGRKIFRTRFLLLSFIFLLLGLSPYLYLPLRARAHPPLNWGNPVTLERFVAHVTGREYGKMLFYKSQQKVVDNAVTFFLSLASNLNLAGLALATMGIFLSYKNKKVLSVFLVFVFVFQLLFYANYKIPNIETFYLPAFFVFSLWIGWGAKIVLEFIDQFYQLLASKITTFLISVELPPKWGRKEWNLSVASFARGVLIIGLFVCPLYNLFRNYSLVDLSRDFEAASYGEGVFAQLEPNAVVLTEGDKFSLVLDYYRWVVYKDRTDLAVFTNGIYLQDWRVENAKRLYPWVSFPDRPITDNPREALRATMALIEANVDKYPIYLTLDYPPPREDLAQRLKIEDFIIQSQGPIYKVVGKIEIGD